MQSKGVKEAGRGSEGRRGRLGIERQEIGSKEEGSSKSGELKGKEGRGGDELRTCSGVVHWSGGRTAFFMLRSSARLRRNSLSYCSSSGSRRMAS